MSSLQEIADQIASCRLCDQQGIAVCHAPLMNRGTGREVLIIGIEPGNTELETGQAFSGLAGKRLMNWLTDAGLGDDRSAILQRAYMTSLCKCNISAKKHLKLAVANCFPFLSAQVRLVAPAICVTLGAEPLRALAARPVDLDDYVGRSWFESDLGTLFPVLPHDCRIIPLPHPSPRSTWLNSHENKQMLLSALDTLRSVLGTT